ncbi:hypothetical protein BASA83_013408 [Batrachochytrium salamandrivorans]|nr:hypothetical protein BASA83_013408 [Batrachochytrium salamandrivorans]
MSLFHFNIPISTNGLFHNPISTNSSITSSNINRSIPNTQSLTPESLLHPLLSPYPNHCRDPTPALQVCTRTYIPSLGQVQIGLQLCAGEPRVKCKFLRSPALSTGQAIGASLLSLARCGGLWDYPRALKAGLLTPHSNNPDQLGSPSLCILCHAHLDCKPMAHLVVDCTHPTVFFARVDTQLLQAINDTRVQIFDCTLHTTTTTPTTTPASPSLSTTHNSTHYNWPSAYGRIWIFILPSTTTSTLQDHFQSAPIPLQPL